MPICPNGHTSVATDYCDTCGSPMPPGSQPDAVAPVPGQPIPDAVGAVPPAPGSFVPPPAGGAPAVKTCPNCHAANPGSALFCEACGYDFTTGSLPRMSTLGGAPVTPPVPAEGGTAPAVPPASDAAGTPEAPVADVPAAPAPPAPHPFDLDAPPPPAPVPSLDLDAPPPVRAPGRLGGATAYRFPDEPAEPSGQPPEDVSAQAETSTPTVPGAASEPSAPATPVDAPASQAETPAEPVSAESPASGLSTPVPPPVSTPVPAPAPGPTPVPMPPAAPTPVPMPPAGPTPVPVPPTPVPVVPVPESMSVAQAPVAPAPDAQAATPQAPAAQAPVTQPPAQGGPTASDVPLGKAEWVAEVWIDPDWYAGQDSPDQIPSPGLPRVIGLRKRASLIGRPSKSRGIVPDVDCEPDTGVSRRHAELITDGTRWWVEDVGSSNGTFVGVAGSPLPTEPIRVRTELGEDARVYVGSWTRVVVRRANPDEADL